MGFTAVEGLMMGTRCGAIDPGVILYLLIHGKMTIGDRNREVTKFMENKDIRILVATPGAAKEGLTLTAANHVIYFDRVFSLDDYLQSQDRIHRISLRLFPPTDPRW